MISSAQRKRGTVEQALALPIEALRVGKTERGGGGEERNPAGFRRGRWIRRSRLFWRNGRGSEIAGSASVIGNQSIPTAVITILNVKTTVKLIPARLNFGVRFFFECPECSRRARILYLPPGENVIACRRCNGLRYWSQSVGQRSFWKSMQQKTGFPQRSLKLWFFAAGKVAIKSCLTESEGAGQPKQDFERG